jgi:hypothetical protein
MYNILFSSVLYLWSEVHKLIHSICNKEELSDQWMESIIVSIYKKGDCSNYHGISLLSTLYKMSNILLSREVHI